MTNLPATVTFQDTELSIVDHQGRPWLTAADLSRALGYSRADKVTRLYDRHKDEFTEDMTQVIDFSEPHFGELTKDQELAKTKGIRIFSPRGCHLIAMFARTDRAKAFRKWVLDVLEAYTSKRQQSEETLTPSEQQTLQEIARAKVQDLPDDLKGKALAEIWSRVHRKFRVAKYSQLQRDKLAEAILYINRMSLKCLPKPEGLKLLKEPDDIGPKTRAIIDRRAQELALQSFQRAREALEDLARQWKQVRPFLSDGAIAEFIATRDLRKESYLVVRRGAVYEITSAVAALQPLMAHILEAIEQLETETDLPWHGKSQVKAH